jgi:hypothetical protein
MVGELQAENSIWKAAKMNCGGGVEAKNHLPLWPEELRVGKEQSRRSRRW